MGKRGPKPKAPELEAAQGFPRRRKGETKRQLEQKLASRVEPADSASVPPAVPDHIPEPPCHLGKIARRIWATMLADPAVRVNIKVSDHFALANYCKLQAIIAARKIPPKPTYDVPIMAKERDPDGGTSETQIGIRKKANPEFAAWLSTLKEVRAFEERIGLNPMARVGLERALAGKPASALPDDQPQAASPEQSGSRGPLGVLKNPERMN